MTRYPIVFTVGLICVWVTPCAARAVTVPGGTTLLVRTVDRVSSNDKAGKSFAARLDANLVVKGKVVVPSGSKVYGRVESSKSAGRAFGRSKLALTKVVSWPLQSVDQPVLRVHLTKFQYIPFTS